MTSAENPIPQVSLTIKYVVQGDALSPSVFVNLFNCAASHTWAIVVDAALGVLEELRIPSTTRYALMQLLNRKESGQPAPAVVTEVHKGSWEVVVTIAASSVLMILGKYVEPTVRQAWEGSVLQGSLHDFCRNRLFGGAKRTLDHEAIRHPDWRALRISEVDATVTEVGEPTIRVRLERRVEIEGSDIETDLLGERLARLMSSGDDA